jgi:Putative zinc-finger
MDHLDAAQNKAVERYMLGDLTASEVEEFERHFFDCPQCSEELRALTMFRENARAVFLEPNSAPVPAAVTVPKSAGGWWAGFSPLRFSMGMALGALVVGLFVGFVAFRSKDSVLAVSAYPLYAQARGEETVVAPAAGSKFYMLYLDHTWDGDYPHPRAVLLDEAGTEKFAVPVKVGADGDAVHVLVPIRQLSAGKYVLVMRSGDDRDSELARCPFTLKLP